MSLVKHPGKLTITTQRGTIHGNEKADTLSQGTQAKNLYMIPNPGAQDTDFVMTTCIESFAPTTNWQQAGLMIYDGDDNYVKGDLEWDQRGPSAVVPIFLRETNQQSDYSSVIPEEASEAYWLRVTKRGTLYEFAYSTNGEEYVIVGEKSWGNGAPKWVGIFAKNGGNPLATDIDAQFDFFEVRSLTNAEKNEPSYLERQRLQGAWKVVSFSVSGKPIDNVDLSQFVFTNSEVTIKEGAKTTKGEYRLDVARQPKQLVLANLFSLQDRPVTAAYSCSEDTLKICLDPRPGAASPTDLATQQGDSRMLITLRRVSRSD